MKPQVVVTFVPDSDVREVIAEELGLTAQVTYLPNVGPEDRARVLSFADGVLGWGLSRELATREEFEALASAKLVQVLSAGVESLPFHLIPTEVPLASNAGAWARPMAEHVVAMTLTLAKHLPQRHAELKRGLFNQQAPNRDIIGSVIGIIGFGGIGRATAALFEAFGARIHAINRSGESVEGAEWLGSLDDLDALLSEADVVVICLPFTRATQGLIGRRELSLMKPSAILVNVARAGIVDEDALFEHLERHRSFSAGIDVWWHEWRRPFTARRPFLDLPNVIGSPHNSANTESSLTQAVRHAAANIAHALLGEPVRNLIDRADYVA